MNIRKFLIRESREQDLRKKYSNKFSREALDYFFSTPELKKYNHKYTDFLLRTIDPNTDIVWWIEYGVKQIENFDKYQKNLQKKDINQYRSIEDVADALTPFLEKAKEKELSKQIHKIFEDDQFIVLRPLTEESSCKYGSNTRWCVTQKETGYFQKYTQGSQKLYFIINKQNSTDELYSKVAIHFDEEGNMIYYDSQDRQLSPKEKNVFNYAFKNIIELIKSDFKSNYLSRIEKYLYDIFNTKKSIDVVIKVKEDPLTDLIIEVSGFENVEDEQFGFTMGMIELFTRIGGKKEKIDEYLMFTRYSLNEISSFNVDFGLEPTDSYEVNEFDISNLNSDFKVEFKNDKNYVLNEVLTKIANIVVEYIENKYL